MSIQTLAIQAPGVVELLTDPARLALLETARRLARPVSTNELASSLGLDATTTQRGVDNLADVGLLERLPIRANRRTPMYRARVESLVITFDPSNADQLAALANVMVAMRTCVQSWSDGPPGTQGFDGSPWPLQSYRTLQLTHEEIAEFRRLLLEVTQFVESTQTSRSRVDGKTAPKANVTLALEAGKAGPRALPLPTVHFVPGDHAQSFAETSPANTMKDLSPRERQVASMLANGRSRPEIARELGISPNTVGTLSKRIHAKLGVKRRAELSNRIRRGTT